MNLPPLDGLEASVVPGGRIFADSTLIERKVTREDVKVFYIPAMRLAGENGMPTLANMIIVGKVLKELGKFDEDAIAAALKKVISAKHADMMDINLKAMRLGTES